MASAIDISNLEKRGKDQKLVFQKGKEKPFTGWAKKISGKKWQSDWFRFSFKDVPDYLHEPEHAEELRATLFEGIRDIEACYALFHFEDGKPDGVWKIWYKNGQPRELRFFRNGQRMFCPILNIFSFLMLTP